MPRLEDSLKKAILRHGIPEQFYCDNGAVFSSQHLAVICGKLGIKLSHSRPYRPAGRGKIERLFRFIDTSFVPEAYEAIANSKINTLPELNQALVAWVDGYYHQRKHGGTGQTPLARVDKSQRQPLRKTMAELTEIFLWEETRKVDKTGCVRLSGNIYEVDVELSGQKVLLRYDPFDLARIHVWHNQKRFADAVVLDLKKSRHERVKSIQTKKSSIQPVIQPAVPKKEFSFFALAEQKRQNSWQKDTLSYAGRKDVDLHE